MMDHSLAPEPRPGRNCPLSYRYAPVDLSHAAELEARTLFVVGGLYGNGPALASILKRTTGEREPVTLVFNGDFNWFNANAAGFVAVNEEVLRHAALRGNVETELAGDDDDAGCGCGYPDFVGDAEVERSNRIIERLCETARAFPGLRSRLGALPARLVARVRGVRIGVVHGDAESLAGWGFSQELLRERARREAAAAWFAAADVRVFASSHSCLPVMQALDTPRGRCVVANNGAAGMPNFSGLRHGLITRISASPAPDALYGTTVESVRVEALPVAYDHAAFEREFLATWPAGSPAHASYHRRIVAGPSYRSGDAIRLEMPIAA
ncbi:MAG TPA: hypothetical protein VH881_06795 [Burkholderiales bacterium]